MGEKLNLLNETKTHQGNEKIHRVDKLVTEYFDILGIAEVRKLGREVEEHQEYI